jgi:hypothetical protein
VSTSALNHDLQFEGSPYVRGRAKSQAFCPIPPKPCKYDYFNPTKINAFLRLSAFFTGDYLFSNGMVATAARLGARIHGNSEAISLERVGTQWRVRTAQGSVMAKRVVFCTAAYPTDIEPAFQRAF